MPVASWIAWNGRQWSVCVAAIAVVSLASVRAEAQSSAVVVRGAESPFELEVDRLVQDLMQKRRMTLGLVSSLREVQLKLRASELTDLERAQAESNLRQLRARLASLESDGSRIQRRLRDVCDADRKPEGWVGIVYSGSASATREDDGRVTMRFVDYPSIESVEPGSPADKAGIRGGDRMFAMLGRDLRDTQIDFTPMLKPGTRIPFKVRRGAETKVLIVTVAPRPDQYSTPCPWVDERVAAAFAPMQMTVTVTSEDGPPVAVMPNGAGAIARRPSMPVVAPSPPVASPMLLLPPSPPPAVPMPPLPPYGVEGSASTVTFAGAQFVSVGPGLAEALGVERGLLVVSAGRGSAAEQSGLRAGDVLVVVDGDALASPLVFLQAVEQSSRRELRVQIVRRRKPMSAVLKW